MANASEPVVPPPSPPPPAPNASVPAFPPPPALPDAPALNASDISPPTEPPTETAEETVEVPGGFQDTLPPPGENPFVPTAPWILDERWDRVETLAGTLGQKNDFVDGFGADARLNGVRGIGVSNDCARVFIADEKNQAVRQYNTLTGELTTIAGNKVEGGADGCGPAAQFFGPHGVAYTPDEKLWVADTKNNCVRMIDMANGNCVTTVGGVCDPAGGGYQEGVGADTLFDTPRSVTAPRGGGVVYVGDNNNNRIRAYDVATQNWTTLAEDGVKKPSGLAITPEGDAIYLCDESPNNVRRVDTATGEITDVAGSGVSIFEETHIDGPGATAAFWTPRGCATDGKTVYVADMRNNAVRSVDIETTFVKTVFGVGRDDPSTGYSPGLPFDRPVVDGPTWSATTDNPVSLAICTEEIHGLPQELLFVGSDFSDVLRVVFPKSDGGVTEAVQKSGGGER